MLTGQLGAAQHRLVMIIERSRSIACGYTKLMRAQLLDFDVRAPVSLLILPLWAAACEDRQDHEGAKGGPHRVVEVSNGQESSGANPVVAHVRLGVPRVCADQQASGR